MRIRRTQITFRPRSNPGFLKDVSEITDRAKRYRANHPDVRPALPKVCVYCLSRKNVGVGHRDGDESNGKRSNLEWTCKSCNASLALIHKRNGQGRRVRQYNAGKKTKGATSLEQYGFLIKVMRGIEPGDSQKAYDSIMATPAWMRSAYTKKAWDYRKGRDSREEVPF